ncbi:MAG: VOC family protein [Symploca sp. SIO1C4]|uniref:VOC family protein n=1 Tax=Symploca sp. SIO1C4 TaxID=2607765 RepID=A0A6B3NIG1_9CYAN|nr:VOC family protein [Symploca sp. SIO1C4]
MSQKPSTSIGGIYEVCIGTQDPIPLIQYWQQFGYRIGQMGALDASAVNQLYGVNSSLSSIRLYHQDADHGLVRLMVWENPTNEGLKMSSMKAKGSRWTTILTANVLNILNHVEEAVAAGLPIKYTNPCWSVIYNKQKNIRPFMDSLVGVREMMLLEPLTRQVLFERFNYTIPNYGNINESSLFKASQITHLGMIIQDDSKETLKFYEQVLGLLRVFDDIETTYETAQASKPIFELQPHERFLVTAFDDPRSSKSNFMAARSGRMYIMRFPESIELAECFDKAQPGCLGMSLYTYRVQGLEDYFNRVKASAAQKVTEIVVNEFGEASFSFIAPDGYFWTLLQV